MDESVNRGKEIKVNAKAVHVSIIAPCKDCADRHMACHSSCEKYLSYKEQLDLVRDSKSALKMIDDDIRYRVSRMRNHNLRHRRK